MAKTKRILAYVASDFGQATTPFELKEAIKASEGRVVITDLAAENAPLYPEVTNGEIAKAFGADLLLLKAIDFKTLKIAGLADGSSLADFRRLTGAGVGLNLEIADDVADTKRVTAESLALFTAAKADFLSLTAYLKPEATPERIVADIEFVRSQYQGFLMLNPVVAHGDDLNVADLLSYVDAGVDMLVLPAPGAVAGVTESRLADMISTLRQHGALISSTVGTSQEGSDDATIREIALAAKRAGIDVFEFGDAGVAGMASPTAIMQASLTLRGRRHTYIRMARSATR